MDNINLKMSLILGKSQFVDGLELKPKTIDEICEMGYVEYMSTILFLSEGVDGFLKNLSDTEYYMDLYVQRHNLEPLDFFLMFSLSSEEFRNGFIENLAMVLNIEGEQIDIDYDNTTLVIYLSDEDIKLINKESYNEIIKIVRIQCGIESLESKETSEENPADEKTKKLLDKMRKNREKVNQIKSGETDKLESDLADLISALTVRSKSINKFNVGQLTLFQFYDELSRIYISENYDLYLQASMMGAEFEEEAKHWSEKI